MQHTLYGRRRPRWRFDVWYRAWSVATWLQPRHLERHSTAATKTWSMPSYGQRARTGNSACGGDRSEQKHSGSGRSLGGGLRGTALGCRCRRAVGGPPGPVVGAPSMRATRSLSACRSRHFAHVGAQTMPHRRAGPRVAYIQLNGAGLSPAPGLPAAARPARRPPCRRHQSGFPGRCSCRTPLSRPAASGGRDPRRRQAAIPRTTEPQLSEVANHSATCRQQALGAAR